VLAQARSGLSGVTEGFAVGGPFLKGHRLNVLKNGGHPKVLVDGKEVKMAKGSKFSSKDKVVQVEFLDKVEPYKDDKVKLEWSNTHTGKNGLRFDAEGQYALKLPLGVVVYISQEDSMSIIIKMPKVSGQDGLCGNFDDDYTNDGFLQIEGRNVSVEVDSADSLFFEAHSKYTCCSYAQDYGVEIGKSWGKLPEAKQTDWANKNCDALVRGTACADTKMIAKLNQLLNGHANNEDCWGSCGGKGGKCDWCGSGACCRKGWNDDPDECKTAQWYHSKGASHHCVVTGAALLDRPGICDPALKAKAEKTCAEIKVPSLKKDCIFDICVTKDAKMEKDALAEEALDSMAKHDLKVNLDR